MNRFVRPMAMAALTILAMIPIRADEPKSPPLTVLPKKDPYKIIAIALNAQSDLLAFRWTPENGDENVLEQAPILFEAKTGRETRIPLLPGYTATLPAALSDTGVVVGRSSRPPVDNAGQRVSLPGVAFVWDDQAGIRSLGVLPGDTMSHADAISADGKIVAGISIGPNRVRACVWERKGDEWTATPLPQETNHLNVQRVPASRNGKHVAAVDGRTPVLWSRKADGSWAREAIGEPDSLIPRAVNDRAVIAGFRFEQDAQSSKNAVIWSRAAGMKVLEKPKGYVYAELLAINERGIAVGIVDGPHGSAIGPNACVTENGRLRIFAEYPEFSSATVIDDKGNVAGTFEEKEVVEQEIEGQTTPVDAKKPGD